MNLLTYKYETCFYENFESSIIKLMSVITGKLKNEEYEDWDFEDEAIWIDEFMGITDKKRGLDDDLYDYKKLIEFYKRNITKEETAAKNEIQEILNQEYYFEDDFYELNSVMNLRRITLSSLLIALHSMFESKLKEFCSILDKVKPDNKKPLKHREEDKINSYIGYLILRFNQEVKEIKTNKTSIGIYTQIRNRLVHDNGVLDAIKYHKLYNQIMKRNDIELKKFRASINAGLNFLITFKSSFILSYIDLIQTLFKIFTQEARKLYR